MNPGSLQIFFVLFGISTKDSVMAGRLSLAVVLKTTQHKLNFSEFCLFCWLMVQCQDPEEMCLVNTASWLLTRAVSPSPMKHPGLRPLA